MPFAMHGEILNSNLKTINLKYQLQGRMKIWNQLIDNILYQVLKFFFNIFKKKWRKSNNPSIKIYINKIENIFTLKIKTGHRLEHLTQERIKLTVCTRVR